MLTKTELLSQIDYKNKNDAAFAGAEAVLEWVEHAKQEYSSIPGVESVLNTVIQNVRSNLLD